MSKTVPLSASFAIGVIAIAFAFNRIASAANGNTNFGDGSLANVTTGAANSAFGNNALNSDTTGSGDTAVGDAAMFFNTVGDNNTGIGVSALLKNATGSSNTATGASALVENTLGAENTAVGARTMEKNTIGSVNTAVGVNALQFNTIGSANTAVGGFALQESSGDRNTAVGESALEGNSTGHDNVALGTVALQLNSSGSFNTAEGDFVMRFNSTGVQNTANGYLAMGANTGGSFNTAAGASALNKNTSGQRNVALGFRALFSNTTGSGNIALGPNAGFNPTTGSNNIEIGSVGGKTDNAAIRIGAQGTQTSTFIAGINNSAVSGPDVVVNGSGRLGVVVSSARYKKDIRDMGASTEALMKLRPVTFKYRNDDHGITQYGLVAEEVEKIYPELVTYDSDGKVQSVRYSMLSALLLNELQRLALRVRIQADENARENAQIRVLSAQMERLTAKLSVLEGATAHRGASRSLDLMHFQTTLPSDANMGDLKAAIPEASFSRSQ